MGRAGGHGPALVAPEPLQRESLGTPCAGSAGDRARAEPRRPERLGQERTPGSETLCPQAGGRISELGASGSSLEPGGFGSGVCARRVPAPGPRRRARGVQAGKQVCGNRRECGPGPAREKAKGTQLLRAFGNSGLLWKSAQGALHQLPLTSHLGTPFRGNLTPEAPSLPEGSLRPMGIFLRRAL